MKDSFPFAGEHCLEMELVFLEKVLKNFKIIPVLVSEVDESLAYYLAKKLSDNFDEKTLLVVSFDLSHYPPYTIAKIADDETIEGILTGKRKDFIEKINQVESKGYFGLETAACGQKAIEVGLLVAQNLRIKDFRLVHYSNSWDFFGDKTAVVGYGAILGYSKKT